MAKTLKILWNKVQAHAEFVMFCMLLLLQLMPLLCTTYFVTTDGPAHLYNATVLKDLALNHNAAFFEKYYTVNQHFDPNWFSHIVLAVMLILFNPVTAEKLFIAIYAIGFLWSVRALVKHILPQNSWLAFLAFPFVYTFIFQKGFFNYSFSIMLMVICIWYYLRHKSVWHYWVFVLVGVLLSLLCFAAHPVGYMLMLALLIGIALLGFFEGPFSIKQRAINTLKNLFTIGLINFVPVVLLVDFIKRKAHEPVIPATDTFDMRWQALKQMQGLVLFSDSEVQVFHILPYVFLFMVMGCLHYKINRRKLSVYDVFFAAAAACLYYYFHAPDNAMGGSQIAIRVQFLPWFLLLFWFAQSGYNNSVKWYTIIIVSSIMVALMWLRLPAQIAASNLVEEYMSVQEHIAPNSKVLPLSYTYFGKGLNGKNIADRPRYFIHAADYMAAYKPLIMLDNYEGDTGYFPLLWQSNKNPYTFLAPYGSGEDLPPAVDITNYKNKTGEEVDYVLLLCYDKQYAKHPATLNLMAQLNGYDLAFTSANGRAILYTKHK